MATLDPLAKCEQEINRTIHAIELARVDLFLHSQRAIHTEQLLNTILYQMDPPIAEYDSSGGSSNEDLLQRSPGLLTLVVRAKALNASRTKDLQGRLDAQIAKMDELEKQKKGIEEIPNIEKRIEKLDRYLWILKIFCRVYYGVLFLALGVWLPLYLSGHSPWPLSFWDKSRRKVLP